MVFDYVAQQKACAYIRYDAANCAVADWSVQKIYNFIHFRSMPSATAVYWIDSAAAIEEVIVKMLSNTEPVVVEQAQVWFNKINQQPAQMASIRIWNAFDELLN